MAIQLSCLPNDLTSEDLENLEKAGKDGVVFMNNYNFEDFSDMDE